MGGAKKLSAPRFVGWCGGEEFESASELRATGSERNRKDNRASRSRRGFQCRTDRHRCRINVVGEGQSPNPIEIEARNSSGASTKMLRAAGVPNLATSTACTSS